MSDLTKEYFDKQLGKLATKEDLKDEVANLAGMVSRRFDEVEKKLDVRAEVDQLKVQMKKVWDALNIASK
ncbi:MAG: hypothetical protein A2915_00465 [Candidatus Yanofskybacteria bacterium RIFCSPLOWO2_01_FULL_41_34]|uniref:Uncharacterized protein n=1 Tax=Candidatus Yanofskybacteria bacterium RIFCSPHIGHO2_01_FULL_41_26 TaxID=1802661 RepID=A0A1F8EEL7_9BACT|nr:MAG: hypothetical protein A2649_02500 [Candidatus Yanofskybacteria bacterium RIFCSPHIGHO2_01_FULL_41_26]OGN22372.1 MAG: hypothetical protein A2915_00465 [Candidatus Yanofskybacteria bacterium RIFCSPLOWO2_01_FULL_41_34]